VSISKPVKDRIVQAARETPTEIIGLLLGRLEKDTVVIEDSTTHEFSSERHRATLPPNSMAIIADQLVTGKLKGNIVGWYHSHTKDGLFYSERDIATQIRLQQFSSLITGLVVDSSTGEVGYFRVIPGTKQAVRLRESNITVFTDPTQAVPEDRPPSPIAPTPTVEVRRKSVSRIAMTRRTALSIIIITLIVSIGVFAAVLYRYGTATPQQNVMILHTPVSSATVGTPIEIQTNVTGPGRNVTLVYWQTAGGPVTQVRMNPVAAAEYNYFIPAGLVTGNIAYYIKALDPRGRQFNTTVYHIAIADFSLQPQTNSITVYRTRMATLQLQLFPVNEFNQQVELSTNGSPAGLTVGFSPNPATPGGAVGLNIAADATAPNGTFPVTLIGTYAPSTSSQVTRESVIDVTVADFQVAVTPSSDVVHAGSTAAFTMAVTLQKGFVDPVSITDVSGLPQGSNYTVVTSNPTVLAGGPGTTIVTLQVQILEFTKNGTYPIVIVVSGGGVVHSLTAQIIVR
jgi:proteasome lid subunit RPN8/RPN11